MIRNYYIYTIVVLSVLFLTTCSSDDDDWGEDVFVIENSKFGIHSNNTNARETTDGINAAIELAKDKGYSYIKLKKGDYLIRCTGVTGWDTGNGIFIPNNITLDLTGARLYMESNNTVAKMFRIDEVENVTIIGGHLIGNKKEQADTNDSGNCAVEINCSRSVTLKDMKIEKFSGSALWIGYGYVAPNARRLNKNIKILNCEISDSYMQGISIIHADNVEIAHCRIYNIGGVPPGCGIDIEPESDWTGSIPWKSWVENVNIHNNEFRNTQGEGLCFVNDYTTDIVAADNTFENSAIVINRNPKRIRLLRNTLRGWDSYMVARSSEDVYMPLEGPNKNNMEFPERAANCSTQTGYIKETDNYNQCD